MGSGVKVPAGASRANKANTVIGQDRRPQIATANVVSLRNFERSVPLRRRYGKPNSPLALLLLWLFEDPRPRPSAARLNHRNKHARSVLGIVINVNMPAARFG